MASGTAPTSNKQFTEISIGVEGRCDLHGTLEAVPADHNPEPGGAGRTITTLHSREVYRNAWMRVREDEILRSNGKKGIYGVVEKEDSAIIIPIEQDRIWLVEQFRYTIEERAIELPQGSWEMKIDSPEELARGELREELGLDAAKMTYLGSLWIAYGFNRQKQHVYLATGLTQMEKDPDPEEHDLTVRCMTVDQFEQMMIDGTVRDGCTLAAWALYLMWKAGRRPPADPDRAKC
jgi:ADP-ribose pyrophosphatase